MAEITVVVIDPGMDHFPQKVPDSIRVRDLIPIMVTRLRLPGELSYLLVPSWSEEALDPDQSLAGNGVGTGARLKLVPARDGFFAAFLRKLYHEARTKVRDELWEQARRRVELIARLDPYFPDTARLIDILRSRGAALPLPEAAPPRKSPSRTEAPKDRTSYSGAKAVKAAKAPSASGLAGTFAAVLVVSGVAAAAHYKPWEQVDWNQFKPQTQVVQAQQTPPTGQPEAQKPPAEGPAASMVGLWRDNGGNEMRITADGTGTFVRVGEYLARYHFIVGETSCRNIRPVPGKPGTFECEGKFRYVSTGAQPIWRPATVTVTGDRMTWSNGTFPNWERIGQ